MAITKVADGQAAAATISLASTGVAAGDLVIIHAYRNGSTTVPSSPGASWTDILTSGGANTNSRRVGYRIIQAGDNLATIVGTWTNATAIQFIALQGYNSAAPIGGSASGGTNTTTLTTPAVTMTDASGASWVVAFAGSKATNANSVTLSSTTDEGSSQGALNLATGRNVTSYSSRSYSAVVNASGNRMDAVEVRAQATGTGAGAGTASTASGSGIEEMTGTGAGTGAASTASGTGSTGAVISGTGAGTQAAANSSGHQGYAATVLADDPLYYWRLGEASGTTAYDSSGAGAHGTYAGAVTLGAAGAISDSVDPAISLAGLTSTYMKVASLTTVPNKPITLECWAKWNGDTGVNDTSLGGWFHQSGVMACQLYVNSATSTTVNLRIGTEQGNANADCDMSDLDWHHVVGTIDGSGNARLYFDGALVAGPTAVTFSGGASDNPFKIGTYGSDGSHNSWEGSLDEWAVYGTALSAATILAHYDAGAAQVTGTGAGAQAAASASGDGVESVLASGTASQTAPNGSGSGILTLAGSGAGTQTAASASGAALLTLIGTGAGTQAAATGSGSGTSVTNPTGTGAGTQAAATGSGSGLLVLSGTGAGTQTAGTGSGTGTLGLSGTGAGTQTAASASGSGLLVITGSGAGVGAAPSGSGTDTQDAVGTGAGTGAASTAQGSGLLTLLGTGAGAQQASTASGDGLTFENITAAGDGTQASSSAQGTALLIITGTGAGVGAPPSGGPAPVGLPPGVTGSIAGVRYGGTIRLGRPSGEVTPVDENLSTVAVRPGVTGRVE